MPCLIQILTLDNWTTVMHNTMYLVNPATAIFYVGVVVVGVYMVLNLFLAILLDSLDQVRGGHRQQQQQQQQQQNRADNNSRGRPGNSGGSQHID